MASKCSAEKVFEFIKGILPPEILALIEKDPSLKKAFNPDEFLSPISDTQKNHDKLYFEAMENHLAVLCFSHNWNNVMMWSHYSDNHSGFCLGFGEDMTRMIPEDIPAIAVMLAADIIK